MRHPLSAAYPCFIEEEVEWRLKLSDLLRVGDGRPVAQSDMEGRASWGRRQLTGWECRQVLEIHS